MLEPINAEPMKSAMILLDRVCQKTEAGQHRVVLGPNGAGKTSLVRTASDRLSLGRGSVALNPRDLKGTDPAELATRVALVSRSSAPLIRGGQRILSFVRTAAREISTHRGEEYEAEDKARYQNLFGAFGVSHLTQREFRTPSKGEIQRVLLTRSLMLDSEVLILNEPSANLDLGVRELLLSALEKIMSGTRVPQAMLVIHQMEDIPVRVTHAAIMTKGRITAQGPIDETLMGVNLSHVYELPLSAGCDVDHW